MKLTTEQLRKMIREVLSESHGDDFDMGAHVHHKRTGRMRRGEPDPRNLPSGGTEERIDLSYEEKISKAQAAADKAIQVMKSSFPDMSDGFFEAEREKLISAMMNIV